MTTATFNPINPTLNSLTKIDIKALRTADSVSFNTNFSNTPAGSGEPTGRIKTRITCSKEVKNPGPFDAKKISYDLESRANARLCNYTRTTFRAAHNYETNETLSFIAKDAGHTVHYCQNNEEFRTIVELLKAGDSIELIWTVNGDNPMLLKAGFYHSSLSIVVCREIGKSGKTKSMTFPIGSETTMRSFMIQGCYIHSEKTEKAA